jgi:DNA-binding CsgD family transcriptional regulator
VVVPDLLRELDLLIPCGRSFFGWVGADLEATNFYVHNPPPSHDLYLREFYETREYEIFQNNFQRASQFSPSHVFQLYCDRLKVDRRAYQRSDIYNILTPYIDDTLGLIVREPGRVFGSLQLIRSGEPPLFTPRESSLLQAVSGFIAHAMTPAPVVDPACIESGDQALFVAGHDGRVHHAGARARQLLLMALLPGIAPSADRHAFAETPDELVQLCRALSATASGETGQPPPVLRRRNAWGEFVLRAYWFGPTDGETQTPHIGITIERRVPRALALWRRVEALPLTAREKQYCLLAARDRERDDIADAMGLSANTVTTFRRSVYAKLGVHSRAGLVATLQQA